MHILTRRRTHIKTHTHPKKHSPYRLQTPRYTYIEKCMCMDGVCVRECVFINTHTHTQTQVSTNAHAYAHAFANIHTHTL